MRKKIIKTLVAIVMSIVMLTPTSIISFAKESSSADEELEELNYTVGEIITKMEGTDSGTSGKRQGFYITEPVTVSVMLLGRPKDGNGFVRFRLYSLNSKKYIVEKDFYNGASATAEHLLLDEGRYILQVGSSTGGEYVYSGIVMVYK